MWSDTGAQAPLVPQYFQKAFSPGLLKLETIVKGKVNFFLFQHDMPEKQLKVSLDSIVEECVSFVGVDINTCTNCILRYYFTLQHKFFIPLKSGCFLGLSVCLCVWTKHWHFCVANSTQSLQL